MIKLLASDLDGTIVNSDNQINENDKNAIKKVTDAAINFAICTGKTYEMTKDLCKKLNATYGIFCNGAQIINLKTGEELTKSTIDNSKVIECIKIANKNNLHIHLYTDKNIVVEKELKYMALRNYKLYNNEVEFVIVNSLEEYIEKEKPNIFKLIISESKSLDHIKEQINEKKDISVITIRKYNQYKDKILNEEYEYLDIIPLNITKYNAIKKLGSYLNISNDEIMAIGDNINDIEMIQNSGIGVAIRRKLY